MSGTSTPLPLLGLAEELSTLDAPLGDRSLELLVRHLLDRVADAIVDLTQGRTDLSRPDLPAPPHVPTGELPLDRVACSALAARCRRAAGVVAQWGQQAPVDTQPLADRVGTSLDLLAAGLQRLVQDVADESPAAARQRLQRTVRRAVAALTAPAI
ncbi:hypothetical protein [Ornithinimicrobium cryptoxanthini]|uniref:Uncharacterized protein n=1 Tax=Ornithinimicrobium cryptoxanthini TaxID=2934161 RepID=A0ABY4YF27_9MICO|nr:hypothetical protein [Ornithinimicrobium cryptoxanthini]USQ75269.1 hypothetical protein NF557_11620 [Ornithinimicrobium cryptoxanthini]